MVCGTAASGLSAAVDDPVLRNDTARSFIGFYWVYIIISEGVPSCLKSDI